MDIRSILIFIIILQVCCCSEQYKVIKFLQEFIDHNRINSHIYAFLCYESGGLARFLSSPIVFSAFQNIEIDDDLSDPNKFLFLIDLNCPQAIQFLENNVSAKYYAHPYRWLMLDRADNDVNRVPQIKAYPDSNIMVASQSENLTEVHLSQFYKINNSSESYVWEKYGNWTVEEGLTVTQTELIISWRRRNLMGTNLPTSYVLTHNDTINHLDDYIDTHIDSVTKNCFILVRHLIDVLNGTQKYNFVQTWGYKNSKTGKWSGMVGDLESHSSVIGGSSLFLSKERIKTIEYLSMVAPTVGMFLFREPPLSYVSDICLLPFTRQVWLSLSALVAVAMVVVFITLKLQYRDGSYEDNFDEENNVTRTKERNFRPSDYIVNAIGVICQMGSLMQPKFTSARIAIIFLVIAFLFFHTSYTAQIVALLQSTTKSIRTLKDLLESQLTLALDETPFNRHYFGMSTEPIRKAIYEKKILTTTGPRFMNISTGVAEVRKGLFAFYVELSAAYKLMEETYFAHEKCNLMTISYMEFMDTWFAIQKYSPYKEMIKVNIFKIREHGLQNRENLKIYTKKPICSTNGQSFGSVRLTDCYAAIMVLVSGYILSVLVFILEKLFKESIICTF